MPTADVLQYFREKDPRFKDVPDNDLKAFIRDKYPDFAKELTGFAKGSVSDKASKHLKNIHNEQVIAGVDQAQSEDYAKAAKAIPLAVSAAAAPFTGGMSALAAMGFMGATGLAGGLAEKGVKAAVGSKDIPQSPKALAMSLGIDTAVNAAGEGIGRGLVAGASKLAQTFLPKGDISKTLIQRLLVQSAAKGPAGKKLLEKAFIESQDALFGEISNAVAATPAKFAARVQGGKLMTETQTVLSDLYDGLAKIPKAPGEFSGGLTQLTPKAAEKFAQIETDLGLSGGGINTKVPLDALVREKGSLQTLGWTEESLTPKEKDLFQAAAVKMDGIIKKQLANVGPEAERLYGLANKLFQVEVERKASLQIAKRVIKEVAKKSILPLAGATVGYGEGGFKGATAGALVGASIDAAAPSISAWLLERTLTNGPAAAKFRQSIAYYLQGNADSAIKTAGHAFAMAGVKQHISTAIQAATEP